jgi:hypothetical protein
MTTAESLLLIITGLISMILMIALFKEEKEVNIITGLLAAYGGFAFVYGNVMFISSLF